MDSARLDSDQTQALVAEFHVVDSSRAKEVSSTTSVYTNQEYGDQTLATVIIRVWSAPNNYQQRWTFEGENANREAMDKALSQNGWGRLERVERDDN